MAAHYEQPAESHAVTILLIAQFGAAALLFPWIFRNGAMLIASLAAGWLMLFSAAGLAGWNWTSVLPIGTYVSAWIVALGLVRLSLSASQQSFGSAVASLYIIIIGGPIVAYFQADFAASAAPSQPAWLYGPMFQAISTPHHLPPLAWLEPVLVIIVAGGLGFWLENRHRSAPLSYTSAA